MKEEIDLYEEMERLKLEESREGMGAGEDAEDVDKSPGTNERLDNVEENVATGVDLPLNDVV